MMKWIWYGDKKSSQMQVWGLKQISALPRLSETWTEKDILLNMEKSDGRGTQ